jgi:outer membrane protein TolC
MQIERLNRAFVFACLSTVFVGSILCIAPPASAQRVITLYDCLQETLAYSREVLIAAEGKNMSEGHYLEERAKANRPEVVYYESRLGVFKELVTVAQAGNKPRLDFKSNAGWTRDDNFNQTYPGYRFDAGVYLSFPIFDGFLTKGRVVQAKSRLATTELEMKKLLDNIALDARNSLSRMDESVHIVKGLEATTTQAERLLKMAETGYRQGVKTRLEVDDAESNLLTARTNLACTRAEYLIARNRLLWIMGENILTALENPAHGTVCQTPSDHTQ